MLTIQGLTKRYEKEGKAIFDGLSLTVEKSEIVSILGGSGVGKTTLGKCISNLETYEGVILMGGLSPKEATSRKKISIAFQDSALLPFKTVRENILLPIELGVKTISKAVAHKEVDRLLDVLMLNGTADLFPHTLSGGMRQRVSFARALITNPDLLILDETFSALDSLSKMKILVEFSQVLRDMGVTTIAITHDIEQAAFVSDRILILAGQPANIVADISVDYSQPRTLALLTEESFTDTVNKCKKIVYGL